MAARNYQIIYGRRMMIKEALLDSSKGYVKVFFDGNPVDSIYTVDGITDDESGMKKIQLTFLVEEVLFKD